MKRQKEKLKGISTNRFFIPLLYVVASLVMEIVNYAWLGLVDGNGNKILFPSYFVFDLAVILIFAGILVVMQKEKLIYTFFYIFTFFQFLLNLVNATMYKIFGDILSINMLHLGEEAINALAPDFIDWRGSFLHLGVYLFFIICSILLIKLNKKRIEFKHFSSPVIALAIFMVVQSFGFSTYQYQQSVLPTSQSYGREIETSDKYLWENFQFKIDAYEKFGTFGFYAKSITDFIFGEKLYKEDREYYQSYIDEGYVEENPDALLYNDNLIVILCESMDAYAIDPIYTPTLWAMQTGQNAITFTNFYGRNRTNVQEGIILNGSMPKDFIFKAFDDNYTFDYSLPKVFEAGGKEEVVTRYFHANYSSFYNRENMYSNEKIGFDELITIEDYTGEQEYKGFGNWISDESFTSNVMDKFLPTDGTRFLSYFCSVSTHGPYTSDNPIMQEYYNIYDEKYEEYAEWFSSNTDFVLPTDKEEMLQYKRYKSSMMDFDSMVENLLLELEMRGLTDNTSILFFADHNSYYHNMHYTMRGVDKADFSNVEINHLPMFIYSPKLQQMGEKMIREEFCNHYDILPTICDLYGLPSNKNLYQGYSVFSPEIENSFFSSHLSGMFTDKIFSMNISEIYIKKENTTQIDIEKFKENALRYYKKQKAIDTIYTEGINGSKKF